MNDKIREDFPILKKVIYADSACMSLKPKQVIDKMNEYYLEYPACAGRSNHWLSQKLEEEVDSARKKVARFFHAKQNEIIFTRNTTESINLIAHSLKSESVLTTDKEHNSNLVPWLKLKDQGKIKHLIVETTSEGIDLEKYESLLKENDISLVSVHSTSNVDGTSLPVKKMAKIAHSYDTKILIDGAQSAGHMEMDVRDFDFFACSGHKMLAPSGMGILYGRKSALEGLDTFMLGGETVKNTWHGRYELKDVPERFEAGLQNYSGIIGFGAAVDYLDKIGLNKIEKHCKEISRSFHEKIKGLNLTFLGNPENSPVTSFIPRKMNIHELSLLLNGKNICIRSGAFCVHSWFNKHNLPGADRFSFHLYNNEEDVEKIAAFLSTIKNLL